MSRIAACLGVEFPHLKGKIRKSRVFRSALIAESASSSVSALIADANDDGFYLVHTFECGPKEVDRRGFDLPSQEYRLYSWDGVRRFALAFLGETKVSLGEIEVASRRHRRHNL